MYVNYSVMVNVGEKAPDFVLKDQHDRDVRLHDFHGKKVLLAFYVGDWSPVCGPEMACFKDDLGELRNHSIGVLGISVDSVWSHKAWAKHLGIDFSILSDLKREVSRAYGLLRQEGFSERAYLLIDENGIVRWKHVMPNPGDRLEAEDILKGIEKIK